MLKRCEKPEPLLGIRVLELLWVEFDLITTLSLGNAGFEG